MSRPKTEAERKKTHLSEYGTSKLPKRGTGRFRRYAQNYYQKREEERANKKYNRKKYVPKKKKPLRYRRYA